MQLGTTLIVLWSRLSYRCENMRQWLPKEDALSSRVCLWLGLYSRTL